MKLELAVMLFQKEKLTLAQSSRLAEMPRLRFQQLLASRQIPVHYGVDELESDVATMREMGFGSVRQFTDELCKSLAKSEF
jgi:predicted HTH domain antitoxin